MSDAYLIRDAIVRDDLTAEEKKAAVAALGRLLEDVLGHAPHGEAEQPGGYEGEGP